MQQFPGASYESSVLLGLFQTFHLFREDGHTGVRPESDSTHLFVTISWEASAPARALGASRSMAAYINIKHVIHVA